MNTEKICSPYVEKQVRIAESLCKKHGGMLPRSGILRSTGYCHLDNYIREYPDAFAHISQPVRKQRKTLVYYLALVEKLCAKNDGMLPNVACLQKQGHGSLVSFMRRNHADFAHIKQQSRVGKSLAGHVLDAERIASENGGILPRAGKLQEQGYYRVAYCVRNYPDHFKHIRIEKSARSELKEHIATAEKLSRENNGVIPSAVWLKEHGFGALYQCITKKRKHFLRFKIDTHRQLPDHWVAMAEKLTKQHSGVLPCLSWLKQKRYTGLIQCMRVHPELFKHIPQERKRKTIATWVIVATELAKKHGGVLPRHIWLRKNGYITLSCHIQKYPDRFKSIPRYERPNTLLTYVQLAEELCVKHDGRLPHPGWLQRSGYKALYQWMHKCPESFKHIPQINGQKNTELGHINVAMRLCEEHGGTLPHPHWLVTHGHSALYQYIKRFPEKFAHIRQNRKTFVTLEEYLIVAAKLVGAHGGMLPNHQWLRNNGYHGLLSCMDRHRSAFAHIKQYKKIKDLDALFEEAIELADQNGGSLPKLRWLKDNRHHGLYAAIRRFPAKFAHLMPPKNNNLDHWVTIAEELARVNHGYLPNSIWLLSHGHEHLHKYMKKYPDAFAHLI